MKTELILFVQKAYRLKQSKFIESILSINELSDMEKIVNGDWLTHDGIDIDVFEAFCLNLRLLIQKRDGFSIEQVGGISKTWDLKYNKYSTKIADAINMLEKELQKKSMVNIFNKGTTTNKELFEVIFYGGIAHMNLDKREKFIEITEAGFFSIFVFRAFVKVLMQYYNCIQTIAYNIVQYFNHINTIEKANSKRINRRQ